MMNDFRQNWHTASLPLQDNLNTVYYVLEETEYPLHAHVLLEYSCCLLLEA
jgi:hypothetical protein